MRSYKDLEKGDILISSDGDRTMVLSRRDDLMDLSFWNNFEAYRATYHYKEIEELEWKIEQKKEKWKPEYGQKYWTLGTYGVLSGIEDGDDSKDETFGKYSTKEEAQEMFEAVCKFIKERNGEE